MKHIVAAVIVSSSTSAGRCRKRNDTTITSTTVQMDGSLFHRFVLLLRRLVTVAILVVVVVIAPYTAHSLVVVVPPNRGRSVVTNRGSYRSRQPFRRHNHNYNQNNKNRRQLWMIFGTLNNNHGGDVVVGGNNNNNNIITGLPYYFDGSPDDNRHDSENGGNVTLSNTRGGGAGRNSAIKNKTKDTPDVLTSTTTYWKSTIRTATQTMIVQPFRTIMKQISRRMKRKATIDEEDMIERIRTMKVQGVVVVPNTTILPTDVIAIAAQRTSLIGNPLRTEHVQDFAQSMKRWYIRNGYVLHGVTGATLQPSTATVEIAVQEPIHHTVPVNITYYKEMIIDPDTGDITTYRQYRDKNIRRQSFGWQQSGHDSNNDNNRPAFNVTYLPTHRRGHVRPSKIAQALQMIPGQPFQWDPTKWDIVATSGLFSKILQITPRAVVVDRNTDDYDNDSNTNNAVQLQIVAIEAPTKHLEYGVGKNLYHHGTNSGWEGEIDFEHINVFGGGETLGINLRRGTTDRKPSMKCTFSTGRLQETGGYDIEAFKEYIGTTTDGRKKSTIDQTTSTRKKHKEPTRGDEVQKKKKRRNTDVTESADGIVASSGTSASNDELFVDDVANGEDVLSQQTATHQNNNPEIDRRGATIRIKNPIDPNTIRNSIISASIERTSSSSFPSGGTLQQHHPSETIGSTTVDIGPFVRELPMNARSNLDMSITAGARFASQQKQHPIVDDSMTHPRDDSDISSPVSLSSSSSNGVIPYVTMSATTRQLFPVLSGNNNNRNRFRRRNRNLITSSNRNNINGINVSGGSDDNNPFLLEQRPATINNNDAVDDGIGRPLILALKHTMIVSSNGIPQHVGTAIATSTNVRGCTVTSTESFATTALRGTTELRVPLYIPSIIPNERIQNFLFQQQRDANIVVYSDWLLSLKDRNNDHHHDGNIDDMTGTSSDRNKNSLFHRKSCIGIGLRKSIQGIPLQYDITYSHEGKFKALFGLGRDFVF